MTLGALDLRASKHETGPRTRNDGGGNMGIEKPENVRRSTLHGERRSRMVRGIRLGIWETSNGKCMFV